VPNGSSPTAVLSGGVHWVRSISLLPAIEPFRSATKAEMHKFAASKKKQVRFIPHSVRLNGRIQRRLSSLPLSLQRRAWRRKLSNTIALLSLIREKTDASFGRGGRLSMAQRGDGTPSNSLVARFGRCGQRMRTKFAAPATLSGRGRASSCLIPRCSAIRGSPTPNTASILCTLSSTDSSAML
jgi:hypothetical protein